LYGFVTVFLSAWGSFGTEASPPLIDKTTPQYRFDFIVSWRRGTEGSSLMEIIPP
jgi:hypothetical protein